MEKIWRPERPWEPENKSNRKKEPENLGLGYSSPTNISTFLQLGFFQEQKCISGGD